MGLASPQDSPLPVPQSKESRDSRFNRNSLAPQSDFESQFIQKSSSDYFTREDESPRSLQASTHFSDALGVFFSSPLAKGPSAASFIKLTRTSAATPESGLPRSFRMEAWSRKYT